MTIAATVVPSGDCVYNCITRLKFIKISHLYSGSESKAITCILLWATLFLFCCALFDPQNYHCDSGVQRRSALSGCVQTYLPIFVFEFHPTSTANIPHMFANLFSSKMLKLHSTIRSHSTNISPHVQRQPCSLQSVTIEALWCSG